MGLLSDMLRFAAFISFVLAIHGSPNCPEDCSCSHSTQEVVGPVYKVLCVQKGLLSIPDLTVLQAIQLPVVLNLEQNEIKSVSMLDFPPGLNIFSLDLTKNPEMKIAQDAFNNMNMTLKKLVLEAIKMTFEHPLAMLNKLSVLEELSLSHNNRVGYVTGAIEDIRVSLFQGPVVRSLKILRMSNCGIRSMVHSTLAGLHALEELDLSKNKFAQVPSTIKHLKNLKSLFMFRSGLHTVEDNSFQGMKSLEVIELNTNTIKTLSKDAFKGLEHSLKKLRLDRCFMQQIPTEALANLYKLEYLDLSQNAFTIAPPKVFVGHYCLRTLLISSENMVVDTSTFAGQETCIRDLTMKQMKLTRVPREALVHLKSLQELNLENNLIHRLPKNAFFGIKAMIISLAYNNLTHIEPGAFNGLPKRVSINLRHTHVSDIDFLIDYPEDAIETVNLDNAHLLCRCSMKSSLNATLNVNIHGTCMKQNLVLNLNSNRLAAILDEACLEESASNSSSLTMRTITTQIVLFFAMWWGTRV
ncbi:insulin-like growth factor-binding protein complex acid labile subunit [Physella acuta]|uniref:insulin-like growth factor-binding protein complex acid labile subunit n=1 Tax=Physella acuta TaxID=109671 RepID=UPI0027DCDB98|nr:insulin-like growth factor-binding protein complex acid labile subunit [Physella acuta]